MLRKSRMYIFCILLCLSEIITGFTDVRFISHTPLYFYNLDIKTIYNIYTLNTNRDEHGNPITIVHMPKYSIEYKIFLSEFLHMDKDSYEKTLKFTSSSWVEMHVKYAKNCWDMVEIIKNTPASIGYISPFIYINQGDGKMKIIDFDSEYDDFDSEYDDDLEF